MRTTPKVSEEDVTSFLDKLLSFGQTYDDTYTFNDINDAYLPELPDLKGSDLGLPSWEELSEIGSQPRPPLYYPVLSPLSEIEEYYERPENLTYNAQSAIILDLDFSAVFAVDVIHDEIGRDIIHRDVDHKDLIRLALKRAGHTCDPASFKGEYTKNVTAKEFVCGYFGIPDYNTLSIRRYDITVYYDDAQLTISKCADFAYALSGCISSNEEETREELEDIYDDHSEMEKWDFYQNFALEYGVDISKFSDVITFDLTKPPTVNSARVLSFYEQLGDKLLDLYFITRYMPDLDGIGAFSSIRANLASNRNYAANFISTGLSYYFKVGPDVYPRLADTFETLVGMVFEVGGNSLSKLYSVLDRMNLTIYIDSSNKHDLFIPFDILKFCSENDYTCHYSKDTFYMFDEYGHYRSEFYYLFLPVESARFLQGFCPGKTGDILERINLNIRKRDLHYVEPIDRYSIMKERLEKTKVRYAPPPQYATPKEQHSKSKQLLSSVGPKSSRPPDIIPKATDESLVGAVSYFSRDWTDRDMVSIVHYRKQLRELEILNWTVANSPDSTIYKPSFYSEISLNYEERGYTFSVVSAPNKKAAKNAVASLVSENFGLI